MIDATVQTIPLGQIFPSKTNPRRAPANGDARQRELEESVRAHGVLQPVLVRPQPKPKGPPGFELVAGHRRYTAAIAAGLPEIPALVRELTDSEALELQLIENLERADLHPLEEAEGYRQLMAVAKYDVARIAEKIGRSAKYVYDRVKLLALTKEAQQLFLENRITAGHAILLARLSPKDQARAMDPDPYADMGLFREEMAEDLFGDRQSTIAARKKDPLAGMTLCSVREFSSWIDENVRLEPKHPETGELFPDVARAVARAEEKAIKVVHITREHRLETKVEGERIFTEGQWRPADGRQKYRNDGYQMVTGKKCSSAVLGVVVLGPGRGQAFDVCVDRSCTTHWPKKKASSDSASKRDSAVKRQQERWERERQERAAMQARWKKAAPKILEATTARVKSAPVEVLGKVLLGSLHISLRAKSAPAIGRGKSAEDLVRHAAFLILSDLILDAYDAARASRELKAFGVDAARILKEAAPPQTSAKAKGRRPRGKKK